MTSLEELSQQLASKWFYLAKPSPAEVLAVLIQVKDAERERLESELARKDAALRRAREDMEGWAVYADTYFREKHGLKDDLASIEAALSPATKPVETEEQRIERPDWHPITRAIKTVEAAGYTVKEDSAGYFSIRETEWLTPETFVSVARAIEASGEGVSNARNCHHLPRTASLRS